MKRQGWLAGRQLTVIDTPGWGAEYTLGQSDGVTSKQIFLSVFLCPPGPHVLLLVVRLTTAFTDAHRIAVQQHLEQIDPLIWRYAMVLFTCGDYLGNVTIEQYIEREGEALQWLIGRCGNMYHVLNNDRKGDRAQVVELLEKVEESLSRYDCCYYQVDKDRVCDGVLRIEKDTESEKSGKVQNDGDILGSKVGEIPPIFVEEHNDFSKLSEETERSVMGKQKRMLSVMDKLRHFVQKRNMNKKFAQSGTITQDQVTEDRDDTRGMHPLQHKMEETGLATRWPSLSESEYPQRWLVF